MSPIVQRAKDIVLDPKGTWPRIEAETATVQSIYVPYVVALAGLAAVCGFIGLSIIGVGGFGVSFRVPIVAGLVGMVVRFVLSLAMVFVIALIVDALAPTFGGQKSQVNALKVVAYGTTAGFLGGVFSLLPSLSILGLLAALYSIYLIYTGLPVLMKCPADKALAYTAVVIVCGIVAGVVLSYVSAMFGGGVGMMGVHRTMGIGPTAGGSGEISIKTPGGEVKIDTARMEAMSKRMEAATKQAEAAEKSGDPQAAAKAAAGVVAAMAGGVQRAVMPPADLKALLPESLGPMARESFEAESNNAMGIAVSSAKARYAADGKTVRLSITDTGGLASVVAAWAGITSEKEDDQRVEKIYKQGERTVHEQYRKDGSHGEYTVLLTNGVMVEAQGDGVPAPTLKAAVDGLDLGRIESLKPSAK